MGRAMCVVAIAWRAHPRWPLILAGNRDELHARPTAPLSRWPDQPGLIAGRDLQSGGTWLGVAETGRLCVITNVRVDGYPRPDRASRGALVSDLLSGSGRYGDPRGARVADFNPFNLLLVDGPEALFLTNWPQPQRHPLPPGIHALSNGTLDAPWSRATALERALRGWLADDDADPASLFTTLADERPPADGGGSAPDAPGAVPIFIRDPVYGTRSSSIVAVDAAGAGQIIERRFDAAGVQLGETRLPFTWPTPPR